MTDTNTETTVPYCVTTRGCPGPSQLVATERGARSGDKWECQTCGIWIITKPDVVPAPVPAPPPSES